MPIIETITAVVERHERLLYGMDNDHMGLKARVIELDRFMAELKEERRDVKEDRRKLLVTVIGGIAVNLAVVLAGIVWSVQAVTK